MTRAAPSSIRRIAPRAGVAAGALLWGTLVAAQARRPAVTLEERVHTLGQQMESPTLDTRMQAFYALITLRANEMGAHPELKDAFNLALIRGLDAENGFEREANAEFAAKAAREGEAARPDHPDSAEGNYFGDIIQAVAGLDDPRALSVLLDDIQTGSGAMAAVAKGGALVFPRLEALSQASDAGSSVCLAVVPKGVCAQFERQAALQTLAMMAAPSLYNRLGRGLRSKLQSDLRTAASPGSKARRETPEALRGLPPSERVWYGFDANHRMLAVRGLARIRNPRNDSIVEDRALHDPSVSVRIAAIFGMQGWRKPSPEPLLRQILKTDPDPAVRDQARAALKALDTPPPKGR
jgi:hypothetical protein